MPALSNTPAAVPLRISKSSLQLLWDESVAWILGHYLQIAIALGFGAAICIVLYGVRLLGERLCRSR